MNDQLSDLTQLAWAQLWQVTMVALVSLLLVRVFCRHRPHLAYVLLLLVVVKCLTPPIWSSPVGVFSWSWAVPTRQNQIADSTTKAHEAKEALERRTEVIDPSVAGVRAEDAAATHADLTSARKALGVEVYLLLTWACGAIVCGAYVATIWLRHLRAIRKTSTPPTDRLTTLCQRVGEKIGLKRRVRLLISSESFGPSCFGVFLPSVVLPEQLVTNVLNENIEPVLAHELIHIRRGDALTALLQVLAGIVWWFHPLVWLVSRQMTREREKCCDEEVVAGTACDPEEYAQGILEVLKLNRPIEPTILFSGIRSVDVTKERLEAIMSRRTKLRSRTPWFCWVILLVLAVLLLPGHTSLHKPVLADDSTDVVESPPGETEPLRFDVEISSATAVTPPADWPEKREALREHIRESIMQLQTDVRFSLKEGEVLKFVPADANLEPLSELRRLYSEGGKRTAWMDFHPMGDQLAVVQWTYGDDRTVADIFDSVLGLKIQYVQGDTELLKRNLLGDWLYRRDPREPHKIDPREVAVVAKAIAKEIEGKYQLELKTVEQPIYVATGDYQFNTVPGPDGKVRRIEGPVAEKADGHFWVPARRRKFTGSVVHSFDEFLGVWGEVLLTPIVDEVSKHPNKTGFFLRFGDKTVENLTEPLATATEKDVIMHFTKQTGLVLKKETRPIQILYVSRGAANSTP